MKTILLTLNSILLVWICFAYFDKGAQAEQYRRAFENMRSEHESYVRTVGRGINSAYTCRRKANDQTNIR